MNLLGFILCLILMFVMPWMVKFAGAVMAILTGDKDLLHETGNLCEDKPFMDLLLPEESPRDRYGAGYNHWYQQWGGGDWPKKPGL